MSDRNEVVVYEDLGRKLHLMTLVEYTENVSQSNIPKTLIVLHAAFYLKDLRLHYSNTNQIAHVVLSAPFMFTVRQSPYQLPIGQFLFKRSAMAQTTVSKPACGSSNSNKLFGRVFYESIGSPKMIIAPMVDRSEFVGSHPRSQTRCGLIRVLGLAHAHPLLPG